METDLLDRALSDFAATAPEYGRFGLSNLGPMAAEVLGQLGHADAIPAWVAAYRERLDAAPPAAEKPLAEEDWPAALGSADRFPEWLALFETELADRPVSAVVGEWVPRLVPGTVAAATHGLIRTAHGLRALGEADTAPRRVEVATGLAYWAARYQELPGPPLLIGHQNVPQALADLPYLPEETPREFLISALVAHVADIADEFEQAVASLGPGGDAVALLDAMAVEGARAYLRNAESDRTPLRSSMRSPRPWRSSWCSPGWPPKTTTPPWRTRGRRWPPSTSPTTSTGTLPTAEDEAPGADVLVARALESGNAHALKLTEAALRCHARTNETVLLLAAADASARRLD